MRKPRGGREPESIGAMAPLPGPLGRAIHSRSSRPVHRVIRLNPPPFERSSRAFAAICGMPTEGPPQTALRPRSQRYTGARRETFSTAGRDLPDQASFPPPVGGSPLAATRRVRDVAARRARGHLGSARDRASSRGHGLHVPSLARSARARRARRRNALPARTKPHPHACRGGVPPRPAPRGGETRAFRARFRDADVLLVDDVQFLAEKLRTEEEFFHTFNALYEAGSQLVITSDRRPRAIEALEIRLQERFECGLVAQLDAPSFEARLAILEQRARADALDGVSSETLAEIATAVTTSVRTLEGALIRVVAYASLRGEPPTPELAHHVLNSLYGVNPRRQATLDDIQNAAATALDVPPDSLLARDRRPRVALARQVAMYLARELTDASLPAIGRHFGGRNHTTVLHAHRHISIELGKRSETTAAVERARSQLRQPPSDRDE